MSYTHTWYGVLLFAISIYVSSGDHVEFANVYHKETGIVLDHGVKHRYEFVLFHVRFTHVVTTVKRVSTLNTTTHYKLMEDPYTQFGLVRLVCGYQLIESHPFPIAMNSQGLPPFLVTMPWLHGAHLDEGRDLFFGLALTRSFHRVNDCQMRFLYTENQNFEPVGEYVLSNGDALHDTVTFTDMPTERRTCSHRSTSPNGQLNRRLLLVAPLACKKRASDEKYEKPFIDVQQHRVAHQVAVRQNIRLYEQILTRNPVAGVFGPIASPVGVFIGTAVAGLFSFVLEHKIVPGIQEGILRRLTERVAPIVGDELPPSLQQTVPYMVADNVPELTSKFLVETAPAEVCPSLTRKVVRALAVDATDKVQYYASRILVRRLGPILTNVLTKCLTHTLVPTIKYTLHYTANTVRCYYCAYDRQHPSGIGLFGATRWMCKDCPDINAGEGNEQLDKWIEDALYYGAYFSKYYSEYYAQMDHVIIDQSVQDDQLKIDFWDNYRPDHVRHTSGMHPDEFNPNHWKADINVHPTANE